MADAAAWVESRPPTAIVVGPDQILWSQQHGASSLEFGCEPGSVGATLTMEDRTSKVVTTLVTDFWGSQMLAGDEHEVFMFLAGDDQASPALVRFRPGVDTVPTVMTAAQDQPAGLVVDATYVYWFAGRGLSASVYRASRAGDGSDVVALASGFVPEVVFDGYLWSGARRVPVAGGAAEAVPASILPAVTSAGVLAARYLDAPGSHADVGVVGTDDTFHVLFPNVEQVDLPNWHLVADHDELFWFGSTSTLFRAQLTDATFHVDASYQAGLEPIAVTDDAILFDFTSRGFASIPR